MWKILGRSLRRERRFDRFNDLRRVRLGLRLEAFEDFSVLTDQEFAEVPFDVARERRVFARQCRIQRVLFGSLDMELGEQRKGDVVLLRTELFDLLGSARLLRSEVVAGK